MTWVTGGVVDESLGVAECWLGSSATSSTVSSSQGLGVGCEAAIPFRLEERAPSHLTVARLSPRVKV